MVQSKTANDKIIVLIPGKFYLTNVNEKFVIVTKIRNLMIKSILPVC